MATTQMTTKAGPGVAQPRREARTRGFQAWTIAALRDLVYAGAVFIWSIAAFTILVTGVSLTVSLPGWLEWLPRVSPEESITPPQTKTRSRVPVGA